MLKKLSFITGLFSLSVCFAEIKVENTYARAAQTSENSALYADIQNTSEEKDTLKSVTFGGCSKIELHTTIYEEKDGHSISKMREVEQGFEIPAGGTFSLSPGHDHVMLLELKEPLKEDSFIQVSFNFEKAGVMTVSVPVKKTVLGSKEKKGCSSCCKHKLKSNS
ncbi:MAG TPA: copper chaperone PCu(A)C [Alphaproteobacteria bacterium]|nr:copper chaperone PCu(A)C [Alphaproteobacteria bacterium]